MKRAIVLLLTSILFLTGCVTNAQEGNHDPDVLEILFLTSVAPHYEEQMQEYVEDLLESEMDDGVTVNVTLSMANFDRLTIELIDKEVDLYVVDRFLDQALLDPYGLASLDVLKDDVDSHVIEQYTMENEDETDEHLYMIELTEEQQFSKDTGLTTEDGLVAAVAQTSPHQEAAIKLLEAWL
ncbi:hypothetical protein SAMN05421734_105139 [Pelagirhabdus alkalitolerans]|uniref:Extracellular solute-binding protein n=1 Tax=Pelagirhabdus alkalitolerans TaxID=1612202 RepID=A0A1G6JVJ6_9BACI|nr:hypothetical protein [Pelagirhabdus alkalitolerans]SDC22026.1 hypothetical protein SAMN05421734_105139 [Pelagirhabdus alkalitolerans]